jgi:hypothetical protein
MAVRSEYVRDHWVKGIGLPAAFLLITLEALLADDPLGYVLSVPFVAGACVALLTAPLLAYALGRVAWSLGFGREDLDDER